MAYPRPPALMEYDSAHLAIAFLATGSGRDGDDPLIRGDSLARWLRSAGLLREQDGAGVLASPPRVRTLSAEAVALRGALAGLLLATSERRPLPPEAVHALNRVLAGGQRTSRFEPAPGGGWTLVEVASGATPLSVLAPIARAGAELVATVDPERLRRCDAPDCATWFVDMSKGGRRRWCSMSSCGNRHKAARHRRKRASRRP